MSKLASIYSAPATALAEAGGGLAGGLVCMAMGAPIIAIPALMIGVWGGITLIRKHVVPLH